MIQLHSRSTKCIGRQLKQDSLVRRATKVHKSSIRERDQVAHVFSVAGLSPLLLKIDKKKDGAFHGLKGEHVLSSPSVHSALHLPSLYHSIGVTMT